MCGAFAKRGELREIELWFPDVAARIRDLESQLQERGAYRCEWGVKKLSGQDRKKLVAPGPLCSGCQLDLF